MPTGRAPATPVPVRGRTGSSGRTGSVEEAAGGDIATTNNREELKAVREALLRDSRRIGDDPAGGSSCAPTALVSSTGCRRSWKRHKNLDLYPTIDPLIDSRVQFEHVRGHSGIPGNERVDALAVEETMRILAATTGGER